MGQTFDSGVLLKNGQKIRAVGDTVFGTNFGSGPWDGARINAEGDILSVWGSGSSQFNEYAEYIDLRQAWEERIVLRTLDGVDLDGDLTADVGTSFFRVWTDAYGEPNLELADRNPDQSATLFVTAWVDTAGTTSFPYELTDDVVAVLRYDTASPVDAPEVLAAPGPSVTVSPNPMHDTTEFSISLERAGRVELSIYDVRGVLVDRVVDDVRPAGVHRIAWNAAATAPAASGVLFYRANVGGEKSRGKFVRIR